MAEAARDQALKSLKGFLANRDFSDLELTCGSDVYKLHKIVVCSRAEFFKKAVQFGGQESQTGKIDLPEDDPATIKLLVQYLYEAEYDPTISAAPITKEQLKVKDRYTGGGYKYNYTFPHKCMEPGTGGNCRNYVDSRFVCPHHSCGSNCGYNCREFRCPQCTAKTVTTIDGSASQLLTHAQVYTVADKYKVVGLKNLCKEKFKIACQLFWNDDNFAIAAHHVFTTTPDNDKGLRDVISSTIADHMALLKKPEIEALMMEFNGLAFDLLKAKAAEAEWV